MKTQLLEDIGQSATLSLVPSGRVSNSTSHDVTHDVAPLRAVVQDIAQARPATPARPRSASGVWRQKPAREPVVPAIQPPDPAPPLEEPPAIEPIASLAPLHVLPPVVNDAPVSSAEPTLGEGAAQSMLAASGPVFDFTQPSPTTVAPDVFKREPTWLERSGSRYLLWGGCALAGALVIGGGLWLYEDRKAASALALVADEMTAEPPVDKAVKRRAIGVKEFTLGADGEVQVAPPARASTASPLSQTTPTVPPLVLLESKPATAVSVDPAPAVEPIKKELQTPPKPVRVAQQAPPAPLPKRVRQAEREQIVAAAKPVRARVERAPERQLARAPVVQAETKLAADAGMAATLKACKAYGYNAAQCVKRACSVTKYGFVCRGK